MEELNRPASDSTGSAAPGRRRFAGGLLAGGVLGSLLATSIAAWSNNNGGPGSWHGGGGRWCRTALSPEARRERMDFALDWTLEKVKATDAQRERVKAIVAQALQDLSPVRDEHLRNRAAFLTAMTQPQVDRAALEELRLAELQLAQKASDRIVNALADAADVLTPEQRGELVRLMQELRR